MTGIPGLIAWLDSDDGRAGLTRLVGSASLAAQQERCRLLLGRFAADFPGRDAVALYSAPGRTEIGGNHTDHQDGRVLAAAVDLDTLTVAAPNAGDVIRIHSPGYPRVEVRLDSLDPLPAERNTSAALVRGICARLTHLGHRIGGFDACLSSSVPSGSGLSSSASFEMLVAVILNDLYNAGRLDPLTLARLGQFAEGTYFGKPCGLMDQVASISGGLVLIDFADPEAPLIQRLDLDFDRLGIALVITETGGSHADLTGEYADIRREMDAVAGFFDKKVLRLVSEEAVRSNLVELRLKLGDRAVLRALHFFGENQRVLDQGTALERRDLQGFLRLVNDSGRSSWMLLQNCYPAKSPTEQGIPLALALSEKLLKEKGGAWRVHGGGFAGTIQAFVPLDMLDAYLSALDGVFGKGKCHPLRVRPLGAVRLSPPG